MKEAALEDPPNSLRSRATPNAAERTQRMIRLVLTSEGALADRGWYAIATSGRQRLRGFASYE